MKQQLSGMKTKHGGHHWESLLESQGYEKESPSRPVGLK